MAAAPQDRPVPADPLVRNISALTVSQLITWTLTAGWTLVVPRLLGPDAIGLLVMAWAVSGIVENLSSLGLPIYLVKSIAAAPQRTPRLMGTAVIIRLGCILPCLALAVIYLRIGHFEGDRAVVVYLAAGIAICFLFVDLFQAAFQGLQQMQYLAYGNILNKGVFTLGSIALVLAGFGAMPLVTMLLVATIAGLVLSVIWSRPYFQIAWRTDLDQVRRMVVESLPYWGFAVFLSIYQWIDSAMLAVMTPAAVVGWYGVPTRVFGTMLFIPTILYTAWLPKLVGAYGVSHDELRRSAKLPIEVVTSLSLPIGIGAALIAAPLITLLYGSAYQPSIPVFMVLALTAIPMYANITISQLLIAANRQGTWMRVLAVASIVNPALNFFLIQLFQARSGNGALGAALSLLVTESLMAVYGTFAVRRLVTAETLGRLARVAVATAGMAVVVWMAARNLPFGGRGGWGLLVQVVAGAASFLLFALLLRVLTREQLRDVLARRDRPVRATPS